MFITASTKKNAHIPVRLECSVTLSRGTQHSEATCYHLLLALRSFVRASHESAPQLHWLKATQALPSRPAGPTATLQVRGRNAPTLKLSEHLLQHPATWSTGHSQCSQMYYFQRNTTAQLTIFTSHHCSA